MLFGAICGLLLLAAAPLVAEQPPSAAVTAFSAYIEKIESRLAQQHRSADSFLAPVTADPKSAQDRLRRGEMIIEDLTPSTGGGFSGALLHDWRGTAFVPGATAADLDRLLRDYDSFPRHFFPQVLQARLLMREGDRLEVKMRVRQHHAITVVADITYDVTVGQLDMQHRYSLSRSKRIEEVKDAGTAAERVLSAQEEHGFLWRLNNYWSYEERGGGLYLQVESVSLTRAIPRGLGWVIRPFVEGIPRESLEFTLQSARTAIGN